MKIFMLFVLFFCSSQVVNAQTTIILKKEDGVYKIPCKVNGVDMKFIFDTGASEVVMSLTEANYMLKNGYLSENDLKGTRNYQIANGDIQEGTIVNLKQIDIGGHRLYNVSASIIHTNNAPLLLGQSALERLGEFSFDYSKNTLTIFDRQKNSNSSYLKNVIISFLVAEKNRDIDDILSFFAKKPTMYWDFSNPTLKKIKEEYYKSWSITKSGENNIKSINKISDKIYDLETEYIFVLNSAEQKSVINTVRFIFDNNSKIILIYNPYK